MAGEVADQAEAVKGGAAASVRPRSRISCYDEDVAGETKMEMNGLVGLVFWGGIWAVAIVSILSPSLNDREVQKTLRHAIDKGQALSPETIEALLPPDPPGLPTDRMFLVGGLMVLAAGLGGIVAGGVLSLDGDYNILPILAGGAFLVVLGSAMLLISRLLRRDSAKLNG